MGPPHGILPVPLRGDGARWPAVGGARGKDVDQIIALATTHERIKNAAVVRRKPKARLLIMPRARIARVVLYGIGT